MDWYWLDWPAATNSSPGTAGGATASSPPPETVIVSCAESPSAMSARSSCAVTAGGAADAVAARRMTAARAAAIGGKRDKFVFISPILDWLIRPLVVVAVAPDRCRRETTCFPFHRVEECACVLLAHLPGLTLGVGGLGGFVLVLVRAGLGLSVALRWSVGRLGLVRFRAAVR